jgi:hypothetical protein
VSRKAHLVYCLSDDGVDVNRIRKGSRTNGLHIAAGWQVPPIHIKLVIVVVPSGHLIMPSPWHPPDILVNANTRQIHLSNLFLKVLLSSFSWFNFFV